MCSLAREITGLFTLMFWTQCYYANSIPCWLRSRCIGGHCGLIGQRVIYIRWNCNVPVMPLIVLRLVRADGPGQAVERARLVGTWAARSGGAVAARLVAVLESVERLPVVTPAGDAPPPAPSASLHLLTKRIRYRTYSILL